MVYVDVNVGVLWGGREAWNEGGGEVVGVTGVVGGVRVGGVAMGEGGCEEGRVGWEEGVVWEVQGRVVVGERQDHSHQAGQGARLGRGVSRIGTRYITVQVKPTFRDFSRKLQKKARYALLKYFPP